MWAEAMGKLEGMDSTDRERLWPQLIQGFKDLSQRLKVLFEFGCKYHVYLNYNYSIRVSELLKNARES